MAREDFRLGCMEPTLIGRLYNTAMSLAYHRTVGDPPSALVVLTLFNENLAVPKTP
jgi:hypothetical protein